MTIMNYARIIIVATAIICFSTAAAAQVVLPEKGQAGGVRQNVYGLGLFGGPATGIGISFRHHLPGTLSYQITGGIIKVSDRISSDIGGEVQYDLIRGTPTRFFVAGGAGYYYSGKTSQNDMSGPGRVGLGVGGEVMIGSGVHGLLELIFCYFTDGTVLPLPQVGFYYYFL
jgi:hypothetical protein